MSTHPMTPLTDAEAVRVLREALIRLRDVGDGPALDACHEALAATAPPKPYRLGGPWLYGPDGDGDEDSWNLSLMSDAQRAAVLDALNQLAEKEAAR